VLVSFGVFYLQYSYSKDTIIQNFVDRHCVDNLKIKDILKTLIDEIQYKFKVRESKDLEKLNKLKELYSKGLSPKEIAKRLNQDVVGGHYEVYVINNEYKIKDGSSPENVGFDLSVYDEYRRVMDEILQGKRHLDISPVHMDIATFNLKKYYLIPSSNPNELLQLAFVVDLFSEAQKLYKKIMQKQKNLIDLQMYYVEKYLIYKIDFKNRYSRKEKTLDVALKQSRDFIRQVQRDIGVKMWGENLVELLEKMLKINHKKLDLVHHRLIVYMPIKGVFNKENIILVKSIYSTKELEDKIYALKKRFILLFLSLMIVIALGYYFIIHKISEEIKEVALRMITNQPVKNTKSFIEEIEILKKEYNAFRDLLNYEVEKNVKLLENNKRFILDTIHQIKTPLSIMTLNLEYLKMNVPSEVKEIVEEIEAAVTILNTSYEDLSYLAGNGILTYEAKEEIDVSEAIKERIKFFSTVAKANHKVIIADIEDGFKYKINKVELDRIIDNNLSNAIKYANLSDIFVTFKNGVLRFESYGEQIKGKYKVFERNYREHSHKRGLGLGLSIVKEICDKYGIEYRLYYQDGKNIFEYKFAKISKKA